MWVAWAFLLHMVSGGALSQLEVPEWLQSYDWQLLLAGGWVRMGCGSVALAVLHVDLSTKAPYMAA